MRTYSKYHAAMKEGYCSSTLMTSTSDAALIRCSSASARKTRSHKIFKKEIAGNFLAARTSRLDQLEVSTAICRCAHRKRQSLN